MQNVHFCHSCQCIMSFSYYIDGGIDLKDLDLFLNSCQHSIINIIQKRNAILPPASSMQLSANKQGIIFTIITANVWSRKEQLVFHTRSC